jgi:hypothetical protein
MASGRTLQRFTRFYQNGYDLTGETRAIPALGAQAEALIDSGLNWEIQGGLPGRAAITTPRISTIFRVETDAADSPYDWITGMNNQLVQQLITPGLRAAPAMGDPAYMAVQQQLPAKLAWDAPLLTTTLDYAPTWFDGNAGAGMMNYAEPWGVLLHPMGAETAASTATGHDGEAATTHGGWLLVQVQSMTGAGSVTFKVQDAASNLNASFADVAGLSVSIASTAVPGSAVAQAATSATIRQYTRFQIVLTGVTSVTFALALARGK